MIQPEKMPEAAWRELAVERFGPDPMRWRFECPICHIEMSIELAKTLPESEQVKLRGKWALESECVGRYLEGMGCDWCAYGLFRGPKFVIRGDGHQTPVFPFAVAGSP